MKTVKRKNYMKNNCLIFFLSILLISCNQPVKQNTQKQQSTKKEKKTNNIAQAEKKKNKIDLPEITDENVKKVLSELGKENKENLLLLKTRKGDMKIRLYDETPLHRANFIMLIKRGFYDGTVFYRVVPDLIIQGGDSDDFTRRKKKRAVGNYTIPAEFHPGLFHKKGALAMARNYEDNPDKRSVSYDFFIVQGEDYDQAGLKQVEIGYELDFTPEQQKVYTRVGGAPHLDGEHTVFGEVVEGLDIIDSIAAVKTGEDDWPVNDVYIDLEILE